MTRPHILLLVKHPLLPSILYPTILGLLVSILPLLHYISPASRLLKSMLSRFLSLLFFCTLQTLPTHCLHTAHFPHSLYCYPSACRWTHQDHWPALTHIVLPHPEVNSGQVSKTRLLLICA